MNSARMDIRICLLYTSTVSLDDPIPGTDGLTYGDIITEDNLNYTPYFTEVC